VTQEYADKVGADGYAADASAMVRVTKRLLEAMGHDVSGGAEASAAATAAVQAIEDLMGAVGKAEAGQASTQP
jgi:methanogenic corrinoid protein MtbC1